MKKSQLLLIKKHKHDEMDDEDNDPEINTLRYIEEIVYQWIEQGRVKGVLNNNESDQENNMTNILADRSTWLSESKRYGSRVVTIEVYFTVFTELTVKELLQDEVEVLKKGNAWLKVKRTRDKHTKKIGFLSGTITSNVNVEWYEKH